ncbi:hypothetical protein ID866_11213 [Astraeus odoratus]|nr:hypothetical protein ID866_11213 [Astraeus odoratus]
MTQLAMIVFLWRMEEQMRMDSEGFWWLGCYHSYPSLTGRKSMCAPLWSGFFLWMRSWMNRWVCVLWHLSSIHGVEEFSQSLHWIPSSMGLI